jgi:Family of unknown function (DUF6221)
MTDSPSIVEFLTARYDEEQALAEATTPTPIAGEWCATRDKHAAADTPLRLVQGCDPYEGEDWNDYESGEYNGTPIIAFSAEWQDEAEANLRHIAYHDPARVLADVAAKRALLALWQKIDSGVYSPDANQVADDIAEQLLAPYEKRAVWTREVGWRVEG